MQVTTARSFNTPRGGGGAGATVVHRAILAGSAAVQLQDYVQPCTYPPPATSSSLRNDTILDRLGCATVTGEQSNSVVNRSIRQATLDTISPGGIRPGIAAGGTKGGKQLCCPTNPPGCSNTS